ncbi:MAG: hypothetical protein KDA72_15335 [Planctomycetales bacterium]|nr:hypothetical protein [Planctomycetales bacterium]
MKIANRTSRDTNCSELDMQTIRRRVANIKSRWAPEVAQARAAEGARRRRELDALVSALMSDFHDDYAANQCETSEDTHGLTLVG